jgi:two-component system chemotaxis response regulator CheB
MKLRPMPVIMVSTLTQRGAEATLAALEIGAFDCIGKPLPGDPRHFGTCGNRQGGGAFAAPSSR